MRLFIFLLSAGSLWIAQATSADETRHERAVAAIRNLGGEVLVDSKKPGHPVTVRLSASDNLDLCLQYSKDLSNLHTCDL